jgi:nucleoside-diphosphate-sugar epimerase
LKIVLGAAGFIGFHLVNSLIDRGDEVIAYDNFDSTIYPERTKLLRVLDLAKRGVRVHKVDGHFDPNSVSRVQDSDTIFNLAATAGLTQSWLKPSIYYQNNTLLVAELLQSLALRGVVPKVVHASTSSVYGTVTLGEAHKVFAPSSPYGLSKLAAEKLLELYSHQHGIRTRILRLFSEYGPPQRPDQLFTIALNTIHKHEPLTVYGDGSNSRTNVFVQDAVRAFLMAESIEGIHVASDIAGNESRTALEVIQTIARKLGKEPSIVHLEERLGDQRTTVGDLKGSYEALGWKPEVSFDEGIVTLVDHFTHHPEYYV